MSNSAIFFDKLIENILMDLHTTMPCKVERMNNDGTADVVPIFMAKFGDSLKPLPVIKNLPILKRKVKTNSNPVEYTVYTQEFEKGDIVLVAFSERAMDNVKSKQIHYPKSKRTHSLEDGIILGFLY